MELVVGPWIQDTKGVFPLAVLTDFRREFSIASRRLRLYAVEREVAESPDELDAAVLRQGVEQVGPQLLTQGAGREIGGAQLAQGADVRVIGHTFTLALHCDSTSGLAVPGWVLSR